MGCGGLKAIPIPLSMNYVVKYMYMMCSFIAEAHEGLEVHETDKHRYNVIYVRR